MYLQVRQRRLELNLTQSELANQSRVSLATLQNIEAGRANPSLETLTALLSALGCELHIRTREIDWGALAAIGVPLLSPREASTTRAHREYLRSQLIALQPHLSVLEPTTREYLAILSFLSALRDHYPEFWRDSSHQIEIWFQKQKVAISPKLRRLALQNLAEYL